ISRPPTETETRYVPGEALRPPPPHVNPPPIEPLRKSGGGAAGRVGVLQRSHCQRLSPELLLTLCLRITSSFTPSQTLTALAPPPDFIYHEIAVPRGVLSPFHTLSAVIAGLNRRSDFHATASRVGRSAASFASTCGVSASSAVASSKIHTLREWVARMRS